MYDYYCIYVLLRLRCTFNGDHANPPHPRHAPFSRFKLGFTECKHLLHTQN